MTGMDPGTDNRSLPAGPRVRCSGCSRDFPSTIALGRHVRCSHRNLRAPEALRCGSATSGTIDLDEVVHSDNPDDLLEVEVPLNVADIVFTFFDRFSDSSVPVFPDVAPLSPPLALLCRKAKSSLMFCCQQKFSNGESGAQYDHEL